MMPTIQQQETGDVLTIVRSINLRMTKVWDSAAGEIQGYDRVRQVKPTERQVSNIFELSDLLTQLEKDSEACIIRGRFVGMAAAQEMLPEILEQDVRAGKRADPPKEGHVLRRVALFPDRPLHYFMIDIDGFKPEGIDPVQDPEAAINQYIETQLPECFQLITFHWQLSSSAGHPSVAGILKAHVWFWLATPQLGEHLEAWVDAQDLEIDKSVFRAVQPNYTAAPIFTNGVADPVPRRSGLCEGMIGDEVDLEIPEQILVKTRVDRKKRQDMADPTEKDNDIGRFARAYEIEEVVDRWLSEVFEFCDGSDTRMNYLLSQSGAKEGAFVSEDRQGIVNTHDSDPFGGRKANKWDLVRHYKFGHLDGALSGQDKEDLGIGRLPSQRAMIAFTNELPEIKATKQGEIEGMFEVIEIETDEHGNEVEVPLPPFRRNRNGEIIPELDNVATALETFHIAGAVFAWDKFLGSEVMRESLDPSMPWAPLEEHHPVELRMRLMDIGFKQPSREVMRDALTVVLKRNETDAAIMWASELKWDGVSRIDGFMEKYFGATDDKAYSRAVSIYLWTALAGRLMSPGIKADIAPILIGGQGAGKSSGIAAMCPKLEWFGELDLSASDAEKARVMRGKLVVEFGEMRGMKKQDAEHTKAFMSRPTDEWRPLYSEKTIQYGRRCLCIGSSNEEEVLTDSTGNRRWAPIHVGAVDREAIVRDRDQLWAEAIELFQKAGIVFHEVEVLARDKHAKHMVSDAWEGPISAWLDEVDDEGRRYRDAPVTIERVMAGALGITLGQIKVGDEGRVRRALRSLGYENKVIWDGAAGKSVRRWVKK